MIKIIIYIINSDRKEQKLGFLMIFYAEYGDIKAYLVTITPIADPSAADVCSMWAGLSSAGRGGGIQSRGGLGSFSVDTH